MMNEAAESEDFERLRELAGDHMTDLAYTYKTFFKMARISQSLSNAIDAVVIVSALGLLDSLVRGTLPASWNVNLAIVVAVGSLLDRGFDFNRKGGEFERAGDAYNSLYKEFREYYRLTLLDDSMSVRDKKAELRELTERHRDLNELTPATWDLAYRLLDEEDVLGNVEVTDAEHDRIL